MSESETWVTPIFLESYTHSRIHHNSEWGHDSLHDVIPDARTYTPAAINCKLSAY